MMKKVTLFITFLLLLSLSAFSFNIGVSNPKVKLKVSPGEVITGSIKISNPSSNEVKVKVYVEDFKYIPPYDGSKKFLPPGTIKNSCAKWISFSPVEFKLPPFGKRNVEYSISVPSSAKGGYYAVMFFETALGQIEESPGSRLLVLGRIGSLFFVETQDSIKKANIDSIKTEGNSIKGIISNTGDVFINAKGTYFVMDSEGMVYDRGRIKDLFLFPGDKADFTLTLSNERIPRGNYTLICNFDLEDGDVAVKEVDFMKKQDNSIEISAVRD